MPYVNVKLTRGGVTKQQKAEIIKGMTDVLVRVLDKNPAMTFIVIEEIDTDAWGVGGEPVEVIRARAKT
jgi:4-oxalocrotonate tautomerase